MRVFRIERKKYVKSTLSGIGASMTSGFRWNSEYTRLVYTSQSRSLALLEIAVHLDLSDDLPTDRVMVEIDVPDKLLIQSIDIKDLAKNWKSFPPHPSTQKLGDNFVLNSKTAVLKVPSCIVPEEFNYLINPLHADSKDIKVISVVPLVIDQRLRSS